ncbi:MAG: dTDP-4-dehydrorhamnose 3,5-epimerase [Bacteroidetes bacterium]|jgi:dTDP-4-dehydrorhamnose 3,5-epimerase|nr:MAG: dTDP-4-dehydrorhamnose 3,5-epimerase [Bacteroidota bacterium]
MKIIETPLAGLYIIEPKVFKDERGYFYESYNQKAFSDAGIKDVFVQDNQSLSQKNVVRGLHFQHPPFAQAKLVRVIKGAVMDVVVDIRKNSPTYGQTFSIELTEDNFLMLYIPIGFAHGFSTLDNNTIFAYKCSAFYNKASEDTILWNDPDLNIQWKVENPIISEKDKFGKKFKDFVSPF